MELDYTAAGTNLVSDVSTSAVTVTSGRLLGAVVVAPGSSSVVDLSSLDIRLPPTLNLVVQAKKASGSAADVSASLIWYEDV